jgi:hypothetical protein
VLRSVSSRMDAARAERSARSIKYEDKGGRPVDLDLSVRVEGCIHSARVYTATLKLVSRSQDLRVRTPSAHSTRVSQFQPKTASSSVQRPASSVPSRRR